MPSLHSRNESSTSFRPPSIGRPHDLRQIGDLRIPRDPHKVLFGCDQNKVFALGPEVSLALERNGVLYGFLKVNYQWEVYARTATQGSEFTILATFPIKPIKLP